MVPIESKEEKEMTKPKQSEFKSKAEFYQAMAYFCADQAELASTERQKEKWYESAQSYEDAAEELEENA